MPADRSPKPKLGDHFKAPPPSGPHAAPPDGSTGGLTQQVWARMGEDAGRDQNLKGTTSAWQCPDLWETPGLEGVRTGFGEGGNHPAPTAPGRTGATAGVDGGEIPVKFLRRARRTLPC